MIQKLLWTTATLSLLLLTGCGKKNPDPSGGNGNISNSTAITGDTVSINENGYGNGSGKNSSADGFQSVYFDFGDYGISSGMQNAIAKDVNVAGSTSNKIKIEGNCDEFGTDEYNYALGLKRAKAVKDSMVSQGVSGSKIVIVSFGESNPVCSSATDSCYGKNRRVDLRLIK
jgi:peptidoglycan-associated lipoprotein